MGRAQAYKLTWFLDSPVCLASRCLSASLGYLQTERAREMGSSHEKRERIIPIPRHAHCAAPAATTAHIEKDQR